MMATCSRAVSEDLSAAFAERFAAHQLSPPKTAAIIDTTSAPTAIHSAAPIRKSYAGAQEVLRGPVRGAQWFRNSVVADRVLSANPSLQAPQSSAEVVRWRRNFDRMVFAGSINAACVAAACWAVPGFSVLGRCRGAELFLASTHARRCSARSFFLLAVASLICCSWSSRAFLRAAASRFRWSSRSSASSCRWSFRSSASILLRSRSSSTLRR